MIKKLPWSIFVIASLLPFLVGLLFFWKTQTHVAPSFFYYKYKKDFPIAELLTTPTGETETDSILARSARLYDQRKYPKALEMLGENFPKDSAHMPLLFLTGLCHLDLKQKENSLTAFEQVKASSHPLATEAKWYVLLTHLQHNEREVAFGLLSTIQDRHAEAAKMLYLDLK